MTEETGSVEAPVDAPVETGSSDWLDSIEESLKTEPSLSDIKDVNSLAKSYVHAQKMIGADKIVMPNDKSTEDEWNDFYAKLGRPEKYEIKQPELREGVDFDPAAAASMEEIMHKAGLSQTQAQSIIDGYWDMIGDQYDSLVEQAQADQEASQEELRKEFGRAFDQKVALAKRAAEEFGGKPFLEWLEKSGQGDNAAIVRMLANAGAQMSESGAMTGEGSQGFALTPNSAKQEIGRLTGDSNFMNQYYDSEEPGHEQAVLKMQELYQFAYPEEVAS